MNHAIEIKNLNVSLAGRRILEDVGLTVRRGGFSVFIGANGAKIGRAHV